jgi:hypothetical protein
MLDRHAGISERGVPVQRMNQVKITTLVMWIIIGLIGLGLTAHKGIFALMKARQAALELHGIISN